MFTITPIGSCRIAGPLRVGQALHGIHVNMARCYGYCHSPAEAVQMARFMQGDATIAEDIWPLVSKSQQHDAMASQTHATSDLYVVELASAKELTIDGLSVQLNYVRATYPDFFADPQRVQAFWEHAATGNIAAMTAFLTECWSTTDAQRKDAAVLARMRLRLVTPESLETDIRTLADLLPDVLFVTHVDAQKADGHAIKSRSRFISMVSETVRNAGLKLYDPTQLMIEFGQTAAIEDHSTGLAHFTTAFSAALMDDWMDRYIAPKTDAAVRQAKRATAAFQAQIAAACNSGQFAKATSRVDALATPKAGLATMLRTTRRTQTQAQKKFSGELSSTLIEQCEHDDLVDAVKTAGALGLFETAKTLATNTSGKIIALPCPVLTNIALRATQAKDIAQATNFAAEACNRFENAQRAQALLADLVVTHQIDLSLALDPAPLAKVQARLSKETIAQALCHSDAPLGTLITTEMTANDIAAIATKRADNLDIIQAANVLAVWREAHKADRLRDKTLSALLDTWAEQAQAMPHPLSRVQTLAALEQSDPRHAGIRKAVRSAKADLLERVRQAGKARDMTALSALATEVEALPSPLPEYDFWCARLHFDQGAFDKAIDLGTKASDDMDNRINLWVLLMRSAVKTKQPALADKAANRVIALSDENSQKLRAEAENIRQNLHAGV